MASYANRSEMRVGIAEKAGMLLLSNGNQESLYGQGSLAGKVEIV